MTQNNPLAVDVLAAFRQRGTMIATAESCTGGMVAAALTDIAGSSDVFDRGFVTYSNEAKMDMLGVSPDILAAHGAVSGETAAAMAAGALANSRADVAVAITGVAGPGGGSLQKPVGLVWFGMAARGGAAEASRMQFEPRDRASIRQRATEHALALLLQAANR